MATSQRVPGTQTHWDPVDINQLAGAVVELQGVANGGSLPALTASAAANAGRRIRNDFDPLKMEGLVARWRPDSIAGTDGTAVASWVDSINGITPIQATGANQPLLKLGANGINGHPVVLFASAGPQYLQLVSPPATILVTGVMTVVTVHRPTTSAGRMRFLCNSGVAIGWGAGMNGGSSLFTLFGKADFTVPSNGMVAANGVATIQFQQINSDNSLTLGANNLYPDYSVASTGPNTGAVTLSIGTTHAIGDNLNGAIAEILYFNRALSQADRQYLIRGLAAYYGIRSGTQYNAPTKATIPTTTGTGVVTEPSELYFPNGWNGYKYWLAFVRYDSLDGNQEEPGIVVSNTRNGSDWVVPPGLTNPITAKPAVGHLADPRIRMSPDNLTMYLLYTRQNTTSTDGVALKSSTNGAAWSAETLIVAAPGNDGTQTMEPCPVHDGTQWNLYTANNLNTALYMERRTTTDLTMQTGWSNPQRVNFKKPAGAANQTLWWHMDVFFLNGVFYMACCDGGGNPQTTSRMIWWGSSVDGINFDLSPTPILAPSDISVSNWDQSSLYRPCFQLSADGANLLVSYSAYNNSLNAGQHFIGHTTIPTWELP